jgi:hypothetical protein
METTLLSNDDVSWLKVLRAKAADADNSVDFVLDRWETEKLLDLVTRIANDAKSANDQMSNMVRLFRAVLKAVL